MLELQPKPAAGGPCPTVRGGGAGSLRISNLAKTAATGAAKTCDEFLEACRDLKLHTGVLSSVMLDRLIHQKSNSDDSAVCWLPAFHFLPLRGYTCAKANMTWAHTHIQTSNTCRYIFMRKVYGVCIGLCACIHLCVYIHTYMFKATRLFI